MKDTPVSLEISVSLFQSEVYDDIAGKASLITAGSVVSTVTTASFIEIAC